MTPRSEPFPHNVTVTVTEPSTLSRRRKFKNTPIDMPVLRHLDSLDLGFVPASTRRRLQRRERALERDEMSEVPWGGISHAELKKRGGRHPGGPPSSPPWRPPPPPAPFDRVGRLFATAESWKELPRNRSLGAAEVALAGRSNVGKSTLLNCLLNLRSRPQLRAAVSPKPGETKCLSFFAAGRGALPTHVVHLPLVSSASPPGVPVLRSRQWRGYPALATLCSRDS